MTSRRPPKVLHVLGSSREGGAEVNVRDLVTRGSNAYLHHVLFLSAPGPISAQISQSGVPTTCASGSSVLGLVRAASALIHLARDGEFAVVVLYGLRANSLGRLIFRVFGHAVVLGGLVSLFPSGRKAKWAIWLDRATFRWTAGYVSNTHAAVAHLVSHGFPARKFWIVPQGVDTGRAVPMAEDAREKARKELGLSLGRPVLACVANLRAVKDHGTLLGAAALAVRHGARFDLLLIGDGEERRHLENLAASLGLSEVARFLGRRPNEEVLRLLQVSDLAVLSSRVEGLPTALVEAMACGCPVVATDVGGTSELVQEGETGLLVAPGDVKGMAAAILELLEDPARRQAMRDAARHRVEQAFSLEAMIRGHETLYAELLADAPSVHAANA